MRPSKIRFSRSEQRSTPKAAQRSNNEQTHTEQPERKLYMQRWHTTDRQPQKNSDANSQRKNLQTEVLRLKDLKDTMVIFKYLFASILWSIVQSSGDFDCRSSNGCNCSTALTHYEYQCPLDDTDVVVQVFPEYGLKIQCIKNISWTTQQLPAIKFGVAESVFFRTCPMPEQGISDIIDRLGVNSTKELQIDFTASFENHTLSSKYFYGLDYLENLILNNNQISEIEEDVFRYLENLTSIDLSVNFIKIKPKMFQYVTNLKLLDLSQNHLKYIPNELFNNLKNLKILFLYSNELTTLNTTLFADLQNLESLDIRNTNLQYIPDQVFYPLSNLRVISLAMNKFKTIPENAFIKNKHLEGIQLNRNKYLEDLPDYLFSNLTHLKYLQLSDCNLKSLPENLLYASGHVQNIYLQDNSLTELPENVFKGLSELENLDLSNNALTNLPSNVFYSLTELKTLNLENNQLVTISQRLFFSLQNLETINLRNNQIVSLHRYSFQRLESLKEINLSYNYLDLTENETTVSPFNNNLRLEKVDLSHNNIVYMSEDWSFSKINLKELDFSFNRITYLHFKHLVVVSHKLVINLSNNNITTVDFSNAEVLARAQGNIDAYTSNGPNIVIHLDGNPIQCDCYIYDFVRYFDRSIDPMVPTLVSITADNLQCHSPHNFIGFPVKSLKPKMLTCRLDQLEPDAICPDHCACVIRPWSKSFIVNCENQNLTEVPNIVLPRGNMFSQTEVYLDGNKIRAGPVRNVAYENVTKLSLSTNYLEELKWLPPKIESLKIDNNNISFLGYETLEMLNTSFLSNVSFGNNPWKCDCLATNFSNYLVTNLAKKSIDANNIQCSKTGKLLVHLNVNELCPNHTAMTITVSVCIAIIGIAIAIFTVFYYRFELEIKVWLYAHNMLLWFVTEEEIDKDKLYDAFISYSHIDEDFVVNQLMPVLEQGPIPYKLCLHIRDWIAGEFIPKQITRSVENSRRTIVVLSPSFLQSVWGKIEFRTAHTQAMKEGRARVIVVLYGDVDLDNDLDDELKAYIKTNTYVKWGDPWFWDKLRYALPHSKLKMTRKTQNIMISLNDKLDLINGIPTTPNAGTTPPPMDGLPPLLLKDHPLNFSTTPPAESGLKPLLITMNK
ncbi:hypothetical protein RN001_006893 [Aquatica leii]|uniref:TIR domain-containing protein n=1 Tax=Aquatica leii TaxID=1421715 RepID=A0AAN7SK47_9COLE|nr:hypothetical protein RN001_006893 [Aquatica leii]